MALSSVPKHFTDGTLTFTDNTPVTPLTLTLVHCTGDTAVSGSNALGGGARSLALYQTRGGSNATTGNTASRAGAHEPFTVSMSVHEYDLTEASVGTLRDWVFRLQTFSAAIGFEGADNEVFSFITALLIEGTDHGDASDQSFTWSRCVCTALDFSEGEPNTFTLSLTVLGTEVAATV